MSLPFQIQIPKRNSACCCGEVLSPGMDYFSALTESEENTYLRQDYCSTCWNAQKQSQARFWKSKVPAKKSIVPPQEKDDQILALLKSSLEQETVESTEESFVLALYLARRRKLALRKELEKDNAILQVYELLENEEMLAVKKMHLTEEQIEAIQLRIAKLLKS